MLAFSDDGCPEKLGCRREDSNTFDEEVQGYASDAECVSGEGLPHRKACREQGGIERKYTKGAEPHSARI
jgi:hypothetical protein